MSYTVPANPSPQLQAALDWIEGCNAWDGELITKPMSDDIHHTVLPTSITHGFPTSTTKQAWLEKWRFGPLAEQFKITIHEIIEAPPDHVIAHLSSTFRLKSRPEEQFGNEYMIIFQVQKDSSGQHKIVRMKEFMDSLRVSNLIKAANEDAAQSSSH
ncbi:hypothetical protein EXIGLDRAFT_838130, partial [Exidia glandulosa HHB12029]